MSAFVVSDLHINVLASFAELCRVSAYWQGQHFEFWREPGRLAAVLHTANVEAVNSRYRQDDVSGTFRFRRVHCPAVTAVQILKALSCYEYQTCDLPAYPDTLARALVDAIRGEAIRQLPGYDAAPWDLSEQDR